jgi:dual-specificity kinase
MVFDLLGLSLYDHMQDSSFRGFSLSQIRSLAKQMLLSVEFLHRLGLVHTDLKPGKLFV